MEQVQAVTMLDNMDFSSLSLEDTHYQLLGVFQIQPDVFSTQENSQCRNHPNLQLWKFRKQLEA